MTNTDHQNPLSDPDTLVQQLADAEQEINELRAETQQLQANIDTLSSEKERLLVENRLAIEDAELARSFKRSNYAPMIETLIEQPLKNLRRQILFTAVLAIIIVIAVTYFLPRVTSTTLPSASPAASAATPSNNNESHSDTSEVVNHAISSPDAFEENAPTNTTSDSVPTNELTGTTPVANNNVNQQENAPAQEPAPATNSTTNPVITQQTKAIIDYIQSAENREDFPKNYTSDKSQLAQLYLIVMQHATNDNLYYEAYLNAMSALGVPESILPQTVDSIIAIDKEFLHSVYSAYTVTHQKQLSGWRYRDIDRRFSSYYRADSPYQLGAWQIVNETQDYQVLPKVFAINIERMMQQAEFNGKAASLGIPNTIYYRAYDESGKNQAVRKLFNNEQLIESDGVLEINTQRYPLTLKKQTIIKVQQALASNGFMNVDIINGLAGPKTGAAIRQYRQTNNLTANSQIDLELLDALNISINYSDLQF